MWNFRTTEIWDNTHWAPPLIVEFTGLPGAGKTTVTRGVISELNSIGYKCLGSDLWRQLRPAHYIKSRRLAKEFYPFFAFCANHKHVALNALSYAVRVTPLNMRSIRLGFSFLKKLYFRKRAIRGDRGEYDIILLGQGLMQYFWSIVVRGSPPPKENLNRLVNSVLGEMPHAVVVFDVDIDTAIERITRRPGTGSYYDNMAPQAVGLLLAKNKSYIDEIVNCAVQLKGTYRLDVNGNDDVQENVNSIVRFIDGIWRTRVNRTSQA